VSELEEDLRALDGENFLRKYHPEKYAKLKGWGAFGDLPAGVTSEVTFNGANFNGDGHTTTGGTA
jgi:hypothetical protein